jgi:hypothetical protein
MIKVLQTVSGRWWNLKSFFFSALCLASCLDFSNVLDFHAFLDLFFSF